MSVPMAHFERMYADSEDPWEYRRRWYERRKRALTLAMLPHARYARAFEPGCSIGELSAELAARCDALLVGDGSEAAVRVARRRLAPWPHVRVEQRLLPDSWPEGTFELVVLGEFGYYLDAKALLGVRERAVRSLAPEGVLVACHWRPPIAEAPLTGDEVHEVLGRARGLHRLARHEEEDFLLEMWSPGADSVARREHLR
ncbi:methyltransferase [Cystobacter fuscus]|uniref:Methyltransferase n=1 Tax=Cystobacter fuscus TaxID=43 RepID=A0A250JF53_9BACT|nr:class I SAM-dependent methyltransferase [Cystobacter fuscus]ATB42220.1 methyltransferase [Cystobacter fuscus]